MASSRLLTDSISSHLLPRHSSRTSFLVPTILSSRVPAIRVATSVITRKTITAWKLQINPLGHPAARPSRSPHPNFSPFFQPPIRFRRQFHNGQLLSFFETQPSFFPCAIMVVCSSCLFYMKWAQNQLRQHRNAAPLERLLRNFFNSLTNYREGRWWNLLTATIMHRTTWHFMMNMICLWEWGTTVVSLLGAPALVVTWVGAGVFASAAGLIYDKMIENKTARSKANGSLSEDDAKIHVQYGGLGASGSIFGIFALLTCMGPHVSMSIPMQRRLYPSWWLLAGSAGFSAAAMQFEWLPDVGHAAHLGGMLFGVLFSVFMRARLK